MNGPNGFMTTVATKNPEMAQNANKLSVPIHLIKNDYDPVPKLAPTWFGFSDVVDVEQRHPAHFRPQCKNKNGTVLGPTQAAACLTTNHCFLFGNDLCGAVCRKQCGLRPGGAGADLVKEDASCENKTVYQ